MSSSGVVTLEVKVRREEVVRFLGYPDGYAPAPHIGALIDEAVADARKLARARGTWQPLAVEQAADVGLAPLDAAGLVVGLVTAGPEIEACVAERLEAGDTTRAVILDAAGSAVAEEAADRLGAEIVGDANVGEALEVPCRLSPGYGSWPLTAQPLLFGILRHRDVGVTLLPSLMMMPRKSISFAMWLGAAGRPIQGLAGCARCVLPHCRYRREPAAEHGSE